MKKAFTLLELMAVVAIIGILLGMVTSAAAGAMKQEREQRANALKTMIKEGVEAYHAQFDEWPGFKPDSLRVDSTEKGDITATHEFSVDDSAKIIYEVVKETVTQNNPLLDVSTLFVYNKSQYDEKKQRRKEGTKVVRGTMVGSNFMDAAKRKSNRSGRNASKQTHIPVSSMVYGYQDKEDGSFRAFKIIYNFQTDSIEVAGT